MRKFPVAAFLALFISIPSLFSQQLPRTLLWRLSGNGLSRPSYIYGTMHVNDPRLFVLGDSLLSAISNSEGFANEIDLNQITPMIIEMVQKEISNAVSVKRLISKKTFDEYGPALAKKFNKPADEISTMDILREKNKWISEGFKGKAMQTFLDAYLTGLADRQGKWIGGIEDFSDQSGLINSLVDESDIRQLVYSDGTGEKSKLEDMTALYLKSDLDGFQRLMNGMDSNYRDQLLIRRNHKMAFRIDSLAHARSMVFALGTAHLPGEEGLISLLKARGFQVDPVFSSKKIKPEDYTVHEVSRPWVEVNDPDGRYKVKMPGNPGNVHFFGVVSMEMYYNIFNGTVYMTYSLPVPYTAKGLDSAEYVMLKQVFGGADYKLEKALVINGISGKSFIQKNAGGFKKVYLLSQDNILYFAMGVSMSEKESSVQAINQFFDSYLPNHTSGVQANNDYVYVDSVHFYGVLLPSKPNPIDNMPSGGKTLKTILILSIDPQTGVYYFCGINECKKGYVFQNDSAVIQIAHDNLLKRYADLTLDTVYSRNNRRILEMEGSMMKAAMRAKTIIVTRGNRYYTTMIMYPPGKWDGSMEKRQNSFHLVDYPPAHWTNVYSSDSLFSTWAPAPISHFDGTDTTTDLLFPHYECFDSNRVHSYIMRADTLDSYFWRKNDSALWMFEKSKFVHHSDTLLSEKIFRKDGLFQYDFLDRPSGANNIMHMRMWLRGNLIYRMSTVQEPETISSENVKLFFDQVHFNRAAEETHVFDSKAAILLRDLRSTDTLISRKANKALKEAPFDAGDIPQLQNALLVSYPEDSMVTNSTNGQIAERIIALNDSSSAGFAGKHFATATDEEEVNGLLDILSAWHNESNYDNLGKLLISSTPKHKLPAWVTEKWKDSLKISAQLFPTVLPLLRDSVLAPVIFDLAEDLLKDSLISMSVFHPWQQAILKYADQRFRKTWKDTLYYTAADYSVIYMLQRMKTDSCNAMLKKWLGVVGNDYHKQEIVLSLLKNGQPVSPVVMQELAANEYTRMDLYRNLKEYKKSAWFPVKYLTQSFFAESLAREAATLFSDQDSDIHFLRVTEMKWQGKMSRFFFYDLFLQDDSEHWLVAAGPFNLNKADISFSQASGDVFAKEQYDEKLAGDQMKALILQMSKKPAD